MNQTATEASSRPIRLKRSIRSIVPQVLVAAVLSRILFLLKEPELVGDTLTINDHLLTGVIVIVVLTLVVRPLLLMFDTCHIISEHHIYSTSGLCSLKKKHIEIPFEDILGVRCEQNLLERLVGVGSVVAWTASADKPEIVMKGLAEPDAAVSFIRGKLDKTILAEKKAHGA